MHVHTSAPAARPPLPRWLADPFDLQGQAARAAARAARAPLPPLTVPTQTQVRPMEPAQHAALVPLEPGELDRIFGCAGRQPVKIDPDVLAEIPAAPTPAPSRQARRWNCRRREKLFGDGRPKPLRPDEKKAILAHALTLQAATESGKAYGQLTAKNIAVLRVLLYQFHNARDGRCFPSYERIAEAANCSRRTVASSIRALEDAGILTWCNRLARIRQDGRTRVIRTSNSYRFMVPPPIVRLSSECKTRSGTSNQESFSNFEGQSQALRNGNRREPNAYQLRLAT